MTSTKPISDLMNDWEIGGTQNKWVCPSDRHLQLRAQLKSGWSVRTTADRSTNSKQNNALTESEKEHIKTVLARAEAGRLREQQRIGKMIDRLEKMKTRATGNGVTQCYLCSTDFGLLAPKSYAAMCLQCRKYVCQKNCGVETYDCVRRENIFLCKICSEYREMWKKSGAWFYKEIPEFVKPAEETTEMRSPPPFYTKAQWQQNVKPQTSTNSTYPSYRHRQSLSDQTGIKPPRARITPSWVREKVQSSIGSGSEEEEEEEVNASTSEEEREASSKEDLLQMNQGQNRRIRPQKRSTFGVTTIQRFAVGAKSRITDTEDSGESRRTTPSTSPRHSPSSYGDDLSQNQSSILASDAKSIDSGVVPSDYSAHTNARISKFPASADVPNPATVVVSAATAAVAVSGTEVYFPLATQLSNSSIKGATARRSSFSRTPSTTSSSGIQKSPEKHTVLESLRIGSSPETRPTIDFERIPQLEQLDAIPEKRPQIKGNFPEEIETKLGRLTPSVVASSNEPPPIPPRSPQMTPLPVHRASQAASPSFSGKMAIPLLGKQKAEMQERSGSSASSASSSACKSGRSIESLPTNFEQLKMEEAATSSAYMSASEDQGKHILSKRFRSPFHWRHKPKGALPRVMGERISATQSTMSLRSSASAERKLPDQTVRRVLSGNDIVTQEDSDADMLGSIQFALLYSAEEMKLRVRLIGAKNLRAMDKNGYSDPYVKLYLIPGASKATKITSKTIEKSLNPEWNEEFTYHGVTEEDRLKKSLRLLVLDRDRIGSDFLGEIRVPLKKLASGIEKNYNLCLEHAMPIEKSDAGNERGKICMSLMYNVQQGSLYVKIKRCVELLGMDSTGFSDPYVKVSLLPLTNKTHRQKTSTKKRTLNPEFFETLTFVVPFKDLPKKTLQIDVFDKDVGRHDDYIGSVLLSTSAKGERQKQWNNCIQNPGNEFEQWHKLEVME